MTLNQNTYNPQKRPVEVKMRMLQANIANRRIKPEDSAERKRLFKLLLGHYLLDQKDQFIKMPLIKEKSPHLKIKKKRALLKLVYNFRRLLGKTNLK